jgi:hypothetical protein
MRYVAAILVKIHIYLISVVRERLADKTFL